MTTKNGTAVIETPGLAIQEALAVLIQQSSQTNQHLQKLAQEMGVLNRQLFETGAVQQLPARPAPVATIVPGDQPQTGWRKQLIKSTCAQVGITKTRSLSKWKLNFYVDGEGRPASAYGRRQGEFASLIQRARGVLPEISPDHFSQETFTQRNKEWQAVGNEGNYEEVFIAPQPFMVEWYEKPADDGKTYAYVERVYPA
jgi:hypothetical protein